MVLAEWCRTRRITSKPYYMRVIGQGLIRLLDSLVFSKFTAPSWQIVHPEREQAATMTQGGNPILQVDEHRKIMKDGVD